MKTEQVEKWVQLSQDFLSAYQEWKANLIKKEQESGFCVSELKSPLHRIGVESVYDKSPPIPSGLILKKQIVNQAALVRVNGDDKFRLTGDFFGYLKKLEDQNRELQVQLDTAVGKLEKSQLEAIRAQNRQNEHKETLNHQMSVLVSEFRKAELEHQIHLKELSDTVDRLQQELAVKTVALNDKASIGSIVKIDQTKSTLLSAVESKNVQVLEVNSNDSNKDLAELRALLASEQSKNAYLATLCDKTNQELLDKEKELDQLWARVYELHQTLKEARESDQAFQNQSIAIEELRSQLELARKTTSLSEQASIIEAMLPSKSDRLIRNDEGWEWTPWMKNVTSKALDVDFFGVMEEFKDLKQHRAQAFKRAKNRGMDMVYQILKELGLIQLTDADTNSDYLNNLEE